MQTTTHNEFSKAEENSAPLFKRFFIYQKERFPLLGHGLLVTAFSFSAMSYSRICRGATGFVETKFFLTGIATTVTLFLLVRIFDEFKDREDDARYRRQLPVPRGLVSLRELAWLGALTVLFQIVINALFFPKMFLLYALVIAYLCLMGKEFFVGEWLKKHPFWYVVSHMLIIPLVDMYASGLDWLMAGAEAPKGLLFFFAVSFMNGIVLEIGRKIRTPENEEFNTYSTMMGAARATRLWLLILFITLGFAITACYYAGYGAWGFAILSAIFIVCSIPGWLFLAKENKTRSRFIEYASALWTIGMYFSLGAIPMLKQLVNA